VCLREDGGSGVGGGVGAEQVRVPILLNTRIRSKALTAPTHPPFLFDALHTQSWVQPANVPQVLTGCGMVASDWLLR
jgi:hypothetical protein